MEPTIAAAAVAKHHQWQQQPRLWRRQQRSSSSGNIHFNGPGSSGAPAPPGRRPCPAMKRMASAPSLPTRILGEKAKLSSHVQLFTVLLALAALCSLTTFLAPAGQGAARLPRSIGLRPSPASATAAHAAAAKAAAAAAVAAAAGPVDTCHAEPGAEYAGEDVIEWGNAHLKDSAGDCCTACQAAQQRGCNVWVWCGSPGGCGERKHRECWLKRQRQMRLSRIAGARGTNFTSGALYDDARRQALLDAEAARLAALRDDGALPLVWLDVGIREGRGGRMRQLGRITFVLFTRQAPRAAENFRQLCTGEKGVVPPGREGAGRPYHLKGASFYRIIDGFIDQAGAQTESVFGGQFKDDPGGLALKHDRKGLLSMANTGPDTNTSHFSIMVEAAPHLNGHYTIFGEAVSGFEVIDAINALAKGKPDNTATAEAGVIITDAGQQRRGSYTPNLEQM